MASDLQNKSKHADGVAAASITKHNQLESSAVSVPASLTLAQRRNLGRVDQLILGWRREHLTKAQPSVTPAAPILLPVEGEA